jgi:hypothetical protein
MYIAAKQANVLLCTSLKALIVRNQDLSFGHSCRFAKVNPPRLKRARVYKHKNRRANNAAPGTHVSLQLTSLDLHGTIAVSAKTCLVTLYLCEDDLSGHFASLL